ncbi:MAG: hypothetical protein ACKORL_10530, partial [Phycisphaerales bacterium]
MNAHPTIHRLARPLAALAVAAAAALGTARPAEAQAGRRMLFAEAFRPDIMQRDLSLMAQQLQLEEWQRPVIEALINDYTTAFNTGDRLDCGIVGVAHGDACLHHLVLQVAHLLVVHGRHRG